jgi:hypothetical protein
MWGWRYISTILELGTRWRWLFSSLETHDAVILFSNWIFAVIVLMQHPLWREVGSVLYNCCWSSPKQSFSGQSPAGPMTIFYCLRFETSSTCRVRSPYLDPQEQTGPVTPPRTGFHFRRLLRLAGLRLMYSTGLHMGLIVQPHVTASLPPEKESPVPIGLGPRAGLQAVG